MFKVLKKFFTGNTGLKIISLVLALALWFYIVNELRRGTEEERQFLNRIVPQEGVSAKKFLIKPIFIGRPRAGYIVDNKNIIIAPEYCIVVGTRQLLGKMRYVYTMPIDVSGVYKTFTKSISLNPIAPGMYMEETLVQVTVPVERKHY